MPHQNDIAESKTSFASPEQGEDTSHAAIPESHIRLVATPTAGLPAEHSPYYRRLVSAGYKGFLQGNIAGATLYGLIGAAVGLIGAVATGGASFLAVPLLAGYGVIKGATTFGQIGSSAAQLAEYAEMNERRNALLDRLYETQSKDEAQEIRRLLQSDTVDKAPSKLIHPRTALIGAIIGAIVIGTLVYFGGTTLAATPIGEGITHILGAVFGEGVLSPSAPGILGAAVTKVVTISTIIGAAAGATIGIDRGWIRRWFDVSEGAVHERDYYEKMAQERAKEATRLHRIGQNEMREAANSVQRSEARVLPPIANVEPPAMEQPSASEVNPSIVSELPQAMVGKVELSEQGRISERQKAAAV